MDTNITATVTENIPGITEIVDATAITVIVARYIQVSGILIISLTLSRYESPDTGNVSLFGPSL
jgi:hypothetical protein